MPLSEWLPKQFESTQPSPPACQASAQAHAWVVAFQPLETEAPSQAPCVGCRVEGIRGPFKGEAESGHIDFDGVQWPTWTPRQPS
jgi:hypothetical protein